MRLTACVLLPVLFLCCVMLSPATASAQVNCDTIPAPPPFPLNHVKTFQFDTWAGTDCWGWLGPDGTEYAIMGTKYGVHFVNANTLEVVDSVAGPGPCGATWRDIKTYRNYCYVVSECTGTNQGMQVIDLQFLPDSVRYLGAYVGPGNQVTSHNLNVDTARGYAYVAKSNYDGFRVVSLQFPSAPFDETEVYTMDIHDVFARNDTVWVAEGWQSTFSVWDLTDKQNPVMLTRLSVPGGGYAHNIWPTDDSRYFITTEETGGHTMKIWDAQDMGNVQMVSAFLAPSGLAHNVHVMGDYAVTSHYESGLQVVDISVPECPSEVARYDTYAGEGPGYNGSWGAYPFTSNGLMYASNLDGRLFIFTTTQSVAFTNFTAAPRVASAPAVIQFNDISHTPATSWNWTFGDGGSSTTKNPSHLYTNGGLYTVQMQTTTASGPGAVQKNNFITLLGDDTLTSADMGVPPNTAGYWEISFANALPVSEIVIPVTMTNVTSSFFLDSISTVGTRTEYFEGNDIVYDDSFAGQLAVRLRANRGGGSPALPPGDGPVARVHFRSRFSAVPGQTSVMTMGTLGAWALDAKTFTTSFVPAFVGGTLTVTPVCVCASHGDVAEDNGFIDSVDLSVLIDHVFFGGSSPATDPDCPHIDRGDFNCDGLDDSIDLAVMIDVVFFGGDGLCDPCACVPYPDGCP